MTKEMSMPSTRKNRLLTAAIALALFLIVGSSTALSELRIALCHNPGTASAHEISVSKSASKAHLDHGDTIGGCELGFYIRAKTGGIIDVPGARLTIPANALDADTLITVRIKDKQLFPEAQRSEIITVVYEFGPTGLSFNVPATLTIAFGEEAISKTGISPLLFWYEEGVGWSVQLGSTSEEGAVTGRIRHFSAGAAGFPIL